MRVFISPAISDAVTLDRFVSGDYPDGFGWTSPEVFDFVYEGNGQPCTPFPIWNESSPTTADARNAAMPAGVKRRGWYEIEAYGGVAAWDADVLAPQIAGFIAAKTASDPGFDPLTFSGWVGLDFESMERFSFSVTTGAYDYYAAHTASAGAAQKRQRFERLVYDLYLAFVRRWKTAMPNSKLFDPYLVPQYLYQWNDTGDATDPYNNGNAGASVVGELGLSVRDALRFQMYGGSRREYSIAGGYRGWLARILELFDAHGFEMYAKAGVGSPGAAPTVNAQGQSVTTVNLMGAAALLKPHVVEHARFAAAARKPMIGIINVNYPPLGQPVDDEGLHVHDAELLVTMLAAQGANVGFWAADVPHTVNRAAGILQGTRNLNPVLARVLGASIPEGIGNPVIPAGSNSFPISGGGSA